MNAPQRLSVLFIDDDATTRKIYTAKLAMAGINAYVVNGPESAITVLNEKKVDVIVTDLIMPAHTGVELIQAVRECAQTKHIPILVFTGGGNPDLMVDAGASGANGILEKYSCPPDKLIAHIQRLATEAKVVR